MQDPKQRMHFWLGNGLLAVALLSLFFMGPLSAVLGVWAMGLWMVLAGIGMYFVMQDKGPKSDHME